MERPPPDKDKTEMPDAMGDECGEGLSVFARQV